jgi:hypothetical protein
MFQHLPCELKLNCAMVEETKCSCKENERTTPFFSWKRVNKKYLICRVTS